MTELEQQVALAMCRTTWVMEPYACDDCLELAPRVAAALRAADTEALLPDGGADVLTTDERDHRDRILAALRGAGQEPTPQ